MTETDLKTFFQHPVPVRPDWADQVCCIGKGSEQCVYLGISGNELCCLKNTSFQKKIEQENQLVLMRTDSKNVPEKNGCSGYTKEMAEENKLGND